MVNIDILAKAHSNAGSILNARCAARLIRQDRIRIAGSWPEGRNPSMDGVAAKRRIARSKAREEKPVLC